MYYIGITPDKIIDGLSKRYFYGIRRDDAGEIILERFDQLKDQTLLINRPGNFSENYPNFQEGVDFFEGRNINHELVYDNLNYEQFVWDSRFLNFYINDDGEFVAVIH